MRITRRPSIGGTPGRESVEPLVAPALPATRTPAATDPPRGTCGPSLSATTAERWVRVCAGVGGLDTISTPLVAELRARMVRDRYHPPARAVAERLLAELTAELLS